MTRMLTERALDRAVERSEENPTNALEVALIIDGALEDSWTIADPTPPGVIGTLARRLARVVGMEELCGMPGVEVSVTHVYTWDEGIEASGYLFPPCGIYLPCGTKERGFA